MPAGAACPAELVFGEFRAEEEARIFGRARAVETGGGEAAGSAGGAAAEHGEQGMEGQEAAAEAEQQAKTVDIQLPE